MRPATFAKGNKKTLAKLKALRKQAQNGSCAISAARCPQVPYFVSIMVFFRYKV